MICDPWLVTVSRSLSLILWTFGAISHIISLFVVFRIFPNYHIFFIIFYLLMILTRIMSAGVKMFGYFYTLAISNGTVPAYVDNLLWIAKFSTQSAALACIFERAYATYYAKSYENSKKRGIILILMVVAAFTTGFEFINNGPNDLGRKITAVSYGVVMTLFTVILIICNRLLVIRSLAKTILSERYQLIENVKALRLLFPFIIAISVNAIFLSAGMVFFDIDTVFNLPQCQQLPYYIPVFYVILLQTTFFNILAPVWICLQHSNVFGCKQFQIDDEKTSVGEKKANDLTIRNVLGVKIADHTVCQKEQYFNQYKNQWA